MFRIFLVVVMSLLGLFTSSLSAQGDQLKSGPMVGAVEMREATIWVQTQGPATVRVDYFDENNSGRVFKTSEVRTEAASAFTAHLLCNQVQPGINYNYRVFVNGREVQRPYRMAFKTPLNWRYRAAPPTLRFAFGSCSFDNDATYDNKGKPYGGNYEIFGNILQKSPDMMLWLGDNTYYREADWFSRTGMQYRYSHARAISELQPLLAGVSNYAVWDDHDYGPNDSDKNYRNKETGLEVFQQFWANPTYGFNREGGITTTFERDDCQFFLMDNRWFRSPDNQLPKEERSILGKEQLDWLIGSLVSSSATFKFVCIGGPVLSSAEVQETYTKIAPSERNYLLSEIVKHGIKNVIFLSGDMHFSELSYYSKDGIRIYDFTASPLTALAYDPGTVANIYRVRTPNTAYNQRAFGMIEVYGQENRRRVKMELYRHDGQKVWEHQIEAQF